MALALRYSARSDVGLLREINEDSGYAGPRLLVIADGVGGHAAGEVASSVAVGVLSGLDEDAPGGDLLEALSTAVRTANTHLRAMVSGDPELAGMGTTVTAMLRAGGRFGLVHVGDSRGYLLRNGTLQQITRDHTFVQSLLDEGRITAEEADHHPQRNVITNALDGREDIDLDLSVRETRPGDRYLLCSDGLSGVVSEDTIRDTLAAEVSTDVAVERLVELALKGGGPDNITAIVADVVEVETKPPSAVPVTVGAAAEGAVKHQRPDTPAAKAAALRPAREESEDDDRGYDDLDGPRRFRRAVLGLLVLVLVASGAYGAYRWSQTQYYVGAQGSNVAIYRGLTQDVGPIRTSTLYREEDIALRDLPTYQQEQVRADIATDGLPDARRLVHRLKEQADACRTLAAATPPPSPSPAPSSSPSPTPSPTPSGSSTPAPASPTPTPTPATSTTISDGTVIDANDCGTQP
jgi:serine/threonine protein phosphatase PrpC